MKRPTQDAVSLAELLSGSPRTTSEGRSLMLFRQGEVQSAEKGRRAVPVTFLHVCSAPPAPGETTREVGRQA